MYRDEYKEIECKKNGRKSLVYICEYGDTTYYVEDGGTIVNMTYSDINEETDIEKIYDFDAITSPDRIESVEDLLNFLSV